METLQETRPEGLKISCSSEEAWEFLRNLLVNSEQRENFWQSLTEERRSQADKVDFGKLIEEEFFKKTFEQKWRKETDLKWGRTDKEALLALKETTLHAITSLVLQRETRSKVPEGWLEREGELFLLSDFVRFVLSSKKIAS